MEEKEFVNEENKQESVAENVAENIVSEKENDVNSIPAKWYVLHTFSGYENVAKKNLETVVEKFNLPNSAIILFPPFLNRYFVSISSIISICVI